MVGDGNAKRERKEDSGEVPVGCQQVEGVNSQWFLFCILSGKKVYFLGVRVWVSLNVLDRWN